MSIQFRNSPSITTDRYTASKSPKAMNRDEHTSIQTIDQRCSPDNKINGQNVKISSFI